MSFTRQSGNCNDGGISGILRKGFVGSSISSECTISQAAVNKELHQVDLLVFGYACKIFRDDIKALEIDQGKHLIPWMGDSSLKIDRYDVRGALCELLPYEPPPRGYGNRLDYLSSEEQRAEQLCEEERYLFLYNDEMDYIIKQEEELKRLQHETRGPSYSQVEFSYDKRQISVHDYNSVKSNITANLPSAVEHDIEEQPFQLPYNFMVPDGILLPKTMKQHIIIEKTARFIALQGVQMEILLKAKQSNNVQFDFLTQNGHLHSYYKYILESVKNGKYPEKLVSKPRTELKKVDNINEPNNDRANYVDNCTVPIPTVRYKPSPDCAYTQLISRIKGVSLPELEEENSRQDNADNNFNSPKLQINDTIQAYDKTLIIGPQRQNEGDSESLEVEVLKNTTALALAQNYSSDSELEEDVAKGNNTIEPKLDFPIPSENLKNIIDKTALYVVKNGRKFEETLLTKSEERFSFLLADNEYYPYYLYKITGDRNAVSTEQKQRKATAVAASLLSKKGLIVEKNTSLVSFSIKTKDDTSASNLQQPILLQDQSDEDEVNDNNKMCINVDYSQQIRSVPEQVQRAIQFVESQLMARNAQLAAFSAPLISTPEELQQTQQQPRQKIQTQEHLEKQKKTCGIIVSKSNTFSNSVLRTTMTSSSTSSNVSQLTAISSKRYHKIHTPLTKLVVERSAIYEQQEQNQHKELKKTEEKVKDKLAQRAREKLGGLISREKLLQFERKRKVMAFLNQIKGVSRDDDGDISGQLNKNYGTIDTENGKCSDDSISVHSIPISSYGPLDDSSHDEQKQKLIIEKYQSRSTIRNTIPHKNLEDSCHYSISSCTDKDKFPKNYTTTIMVSDDEDVELSSDTKQGLCGSALRDFQFLKSERYSLTKKHSHCKRCISRASSSGSLSSHKSHKRQHSKSHSSHKAKKSKMTKSSKRKKKSKKSSRSRSRSLVPSNHLENDRDWYHRHYIQVINSTSKHYSYSRNNSISAISTSHQLHKQEYQENQYRPNSKRQSEAGYSSAHTSKEHKHRRYD